MPPASAAVRGNTGIIATFKPTAGPAKEFFQDIKALEFQGEEMDDSDLTFAEVAGGDVQADTVAITAIQSTIATSFWRFCWDHAGEEVELDYGPHGNAIATADKPHFYAKVKMGLRPNIGGEAKRDKERNSFETTLEVIEGPILVDDPLDDEIDPEV